MRSGQPGAACSVCPAWAPVRRDGAAWVAGSAFGLALVGLVGLPAGWYGPVQGALWLAMPVAAWLLANLFVWMAPTWRITVIYQRGDALGLGFAAAAALLLWLAAWGRWPGGPALFAALALAALAAPFVLARRLRGEAGEPAWWDGAVAVYYLILLASPVLRLPLSPAPGGTLGPLFASLDLGTLAIAAAAATYFFGVRQWQEVSSYWWPDRRDLAAAAWASLAALVAVVPAVGWSGPTAIGPGAAVAAWLSAWAGGGLLAQEVLWRGVALPALLRWLPGPAWAAVALTGLAETALAFLLGPAGYAPVRDPAALVWVAASGLAAGHACRQRRRLFPAILVRAGLLAAWQLLMALAA